jgi:hypothetical protein
MREEWLGGRVDGHASHGSRFKCCQCKSPLLHRNSATLGSRDAHRQLSNYLQDVELACPRVQFGLELVPLLLDGVPGLLNPPGLRPLTAARRDGADVFAGIEGSPNLLADQACRDLPGVFEHGELSLRVHFADAGDPAVSGTAAGIGALGRRPSFLPCRGRAACLTGKPPRAGGAYSGDPSRNFGLWRARSQGEGKWGVFQQLLAQVPWTLATT